MFSRKSFLSDDDFPNDEKEAKKEKKIESAHLEFQQT